MYLKLSKWDVQYTVQNFHTKHSTKGLFNICCKRTILRKFFNNKEYFYRDKSKEKAKTEESKKEKEVESEK